MSLRLGPTLIPILYSTLTADCMDVQRTPPDKVHSLGTKCLSLGVNSFMFFHINAIQMRIGNLCLIEVQAFQIVGCLL